jgi:hypothetical protein
MRLVAQGANIPIRMFRISGRFSPEEGIVDNNIYVEAPVAGVPDFSDLVRTMRFADAQDDAVGFVTVESAPYDGWGLGRPDNLKTEVTIKDNHLVVAVEAPDYLAVEHWSNIVLYDTVKGRLLTGNLVTSRAGADGSLTEICTTLPSRARDGNCLAIVTLDLHPIATVSVTGNEE